MFFYTWCYMISSLEIPSWISWYFVCFACLLLIFDLAFFLILFWGSFTSTRIICLVTSLKLYIEVYWIPQWIHNWRQILSLPQNLSVTNQLILFYDWRLIETQYCVGSLQKSQLIRGHNCFDHAILEKNCC